MIDRWADRYFDIFRAQGELAARSWLSTFINSEDLPAVVAAIQARSGRKK